MEHQKSHTLILTIILPGSSSIYFQIQRLRVDTFYSVYSHELNVNRIFLFGLVFCISTVERFFQRFTEPNTHLQYCPLLQCRGLQANIARFQVVVRAHLDLSSSKYLFFPVLIRWMGERIKLFKYNKYHSIYLSEQSEGKILHTYA